MKAEDVTWWFREGENYLRLAIAAVNNRQQQSALSSLQHAAEFFLKAIIRYHSGEHPYIRNPYTLRHICRLWLTEIDDVFRSGSDSETFLFSLLNPYRFEYGAVSVQHEHLWALILKLESLRELVRRLLQFSASTEQIKIEG